MNNTIEAIAKEFGRILAIRLSASELAAAIEANAVEGDSCVCHTHDYCDANEIMEAALENCRIKIWTASGHIADETSELWNKAWDLSKANRFYFLTGTAK